MLSRSEVGPMHKNVLSNVVLDMVIDLGKHKAAETEQDGEFQTRGDLGLTLE